MLSTSSKPHLSTEEIQKTQAKFSQFRILVIGRANAGKTTILRKVCNTTGDPIIFDPEGNKIKSSTLDPSLKRGEHDIKNQMVFEGNPGFVFHDSRGFEAGGDRELKLVQQFIEQCSKASNVKKQLHAIWYCIPTTDDRPITAAEKTFFNECGTGLVPVIVLWTKTEFLDLDKINQLIKEGNSRSDAMQQAPEKAWADFEKNILQRFSKFKYPPKGYVAFRKMNEPGGDCNELIEKTADALSSEQLQQFFLSTQRNNVDICLKYGVRGMMKQTQLNGMKIFKKNKGNWAGFMVMVLKYFPHLVVCV